MGCRCSDVTGFLLTSPAERRYNAVQQAGVAQLVEYKLPKLGVAGSSPVARSILLIYGEQHVPRQPNALACTPRPCLDSPGRGFLHEETAWSDP